MRQMVFAVAFVQNRKSTEHRTDAGRAGRRNRSRSAV